MCMVRSDSVQDVGFTDCADSLVAFSKVAETTRIQIVCGKKLLKSNFAQMKIP